MTNYAKIYATMAGRAVRQGAIDAETFIRSAALRGMSPAEVQRRLIVDLESNGPVFGKFLRSIAGAGAAAVLTAERQGQMAGSIEAKQARLLSLADTEGSVIGLDEAIDAGDPEALEQAEAELDDEPHTWIATLVNTCHLCIPLHGQMMTLGEWNEIGYNPDSIHANEGWDSECHCSLIPARESGRRSALLAPLRRVPTKDENGRKISRRTARAVTQQDLDKSLAARNAAMETPEGRRTLMALGSVRQRTARAETQQDVKP